MAIQVEGKQISTAKILIREVFAADMWFSIPDYQRPYVWGNDQISQLLDDISRAAVDTPESQYFLGSLVLHCQDKERNGTAYKENDILDGQQRLITLYLLHAVIRDNTPDNTRDDNTRKESCHKVIFQLGNADYGIPERMRIRFAIREEVAEFVNKYVKREGGTLDTDELQREAKDSKDQSVRNMSQAILIMQKWMTDDNNIGVDTFFPYLCQNVVLVYVASGELEDAFTLFTVLNDRGIKLRSSDILKALNLKAVSTDEERGKHAQFWEEVEGDLGEWFDQFLSHIRTILVKERARYNLLKEFEEGIYKKKSKGGTPLLKEGDATFELIKTYKGHHDKVFGGDNRGDTDSWEFDNLVRAMEDTAKSEIWIPCLFFYLQNFGDFKIATFLRLLDNKFSGDWIAGETPTKRNEAMNAILKEIERVTKLDVDKDAKIHRLFESGVFQFDTQQFLYHLEMPIYGRRFAGYILRKVDFLLDAPFYSEQRQSSTLTVEHVLPQKPEENSQWTIDFSQEEIEEWTHKLGNLVLMSRRKNARQGRLDFIDKKEKYFRHNIETFPNSLKVMQKLQWKLADLKAHHDELIGIIKKHYRI